MRHYGRETEKALAILGEGQTPRKLIQAYGEVKLACIRAQQEEASLYPPDFFILLEDAALEVIRGDHDNQFPLPLAQGGAGTSLHMNFCEVLSSLGNSRTKGQFKAHPLEHIGLYQSTNDTLSTAVILMSFRLLEEIESKIIRLQEELVSRETLYQEWVMTGRTEMQDALPMTLGQLFGAWAGPVERDRWRLNKVRERLRLIPLGGTAVGTGFSAPRKYVFAAEKALRRITGLPLCRSQNLCDQVAHWDSLAESAGVLGLCAENLIKWTGDLLLYSSTFLGEIPQEEQQFGSTIMPSKANPVLIELIRGLSLDVHSSADLVKRYASEGQLQLNAYLPFMAEHMIRMGEKLSKALSTASERLLPALKPDRALMEEHLVNSSALINTLREPLGYQNVKELLPLLRKAGLKDRQELIQWLSQNSSMDLKELEDRLHLHHLTSGGKI
ncbi:fumarate lyase [Oceanispirochaeta crateris]|uniref:Fumarate lyase n=1 Tax=Oceanispirochaeta crateris TaxID=2518645 RepID=A0A5C1QLJ1_9SPIO|nr:lyase family protein [Oceanispirochaeta crateris]QEN07022.1 fumarate lyase [Oceanispirochaeta crateris]